MPLVLFADHHLNALGRHDRKDDHCYCLTQNPEAPVAYRPEMTPDDPIASLIGTYHELNPSTVDELHEEPSALDFMRYVARNRPFIVRSGANDWKACRNWTADFLRKVMKGTSVQVAITPLGNADAVVDCGNENLLFVQPYELQEDFDDFLDYVQKDTARINEGSQTGNVKYAQTQNDSLREEYSRLFTDVPSDIPFARIALEKSPDAINFWLGNERSITSLHKDNYENIYVQVTGEKHFILLPPVEMPCTNEQVLVQARYAPCAEDSGDLIAEVDDENDPIPVPLWDPDEPGVRASLYSNLSQPLHVTLRAGDMFYLPAMWYHKVKQSSGPEGFSCSVNYWYDMSFEGSFWASNAFVRDVALAEVKNVRYPKLQTGPTT